MTVETTSNIEILQIPESTFEDIGLTEYPHWVENAFKENKLARIETMFGSKILYLNYDDCIMKLNAGDYLLKPENGKVYGMNKYIFESLYKKFLRKDN